MPTPRLHIIGRKNAGKTTLVVELIERLTGRGLVVGSIKHTHHRHELDVPGKDSYRHREAGAAPVAIVSPGMTAVFRPNRPASPPTATLGSTPSGRGATSSWSREIHRRPRRKSRSGGPWLPSNRWRRSTPRSKA